MNRSSIIHQVRVLCFRRFHHSIHQARAVILLATTDPLRHASTTPAHSERIGAPGWRYTKRPGTRNSGGPTPSHANCSARQSDLALAASAPNSRRSNGYSGIRCFAIVGVCERGIWRLPLCSSRDSAAFDLPALRAVRLSHRLDLGGYRVGRVWIWSWSAFPMRAGISWEVRLAQALQAIRLDLCLLIRV